jgi:hypothetical protein
MLGHRLNAPLDSGGLMPTGSLDAPGPVVAVPIEVKSVRDWIYPTSKELFQLLHKAARIQQAAPSALVLPVLVCRKAHYTTFRMAQQVGFFVIDLLVQYVSAAAGPEEHVAEVRNELGLSDIRTEIEVDERLVRRFRNTLPGSAESLATRWRSTVEDGRMLPTFDLMRRNLTYQERQAKTRELRQVADDLGLEGGW